MRVFTETDRNVFGFKSVLQKSLTYSSQNWEESGEILFSYRLEQLFKLKPCQIIEHIRSKSTDQLSYYIPFSFISDLI